MTGAVARAYSMEGCGRDSVGGASRVVGIVEVCHGGWGKFNAKKAWSGLRLLMVSTTGEHYAYFELGEDLLSDLAVTQLAGFFLR